MPLHRPLATPWRNEQYIGGQGLDVRFVPIADISHFAFNLNVYVR
jgi:hypothetical protein